MPPTQFRACQIDACPERVPKGLAQFGICLNHYLDEAFSRVAAALELCQRGHSLDSRTLDWLTAQGDFTVRMLSKDEYQHSPEQRARLLELLLGLANVQESVRRPTVAKVS